MRKRATVIFKWRNIEIQAVGIPALIAAVLMSICWVLALAFTHAIGCDLIHLCG